MKILKPTFIYFLTAGIISSSCSFFGEPGSPDGPTGTGGSTEGSIELSGSQTEPLTLTDHNPDPNLPDYCVSGTYNVNAAVTVLPGVTICMKENSGIEVGSSGSWNASGTSTSPITVKGLSPIAGYWKSISFYNSSSTNNNLIHNIISDGGSDTYYTALVYGYGTGRVFIDNCVLTRSSKYGLYVYSQDFNLANLSNTSISSCALAPIKITPSQMQKIEESNSAASNGMNYIETIGGYVNSPGNWKKTQIPFYLKGEINVQTNIVVNPGARFIMSSNGQVVVQSTGSLNAIGTPGELIKFYGENSVAGAWGSVTYYNSNNPINIMRYCELTYGGNDPYYNGIVYLYGTSQFKLGNSTITGSQSWGLRNYLGTSSFVNEGGNTFSNNTLGNIGN